MASNIKSKHNVIDRSKRNEAIRRDKEAGFTDDVIAKKYDLSKEMIRRIAPALQYRREDYRRCKMKKLRNMKTPVL